MTKTGLTGLYEKYQQDMRSIGNSIIRLTGTLLLLAGVLSGLFAGGTSASAGMVSSARAENLFFYILNNEGKSVLLKVVPLDDLRKLQHGQLADITSEDDNGLDYKISGIDISGNLQYIEAKGFTVPELVNYIQSVSSVDGADRITYIGDDKIRLMATDSYGIYNRSWSYRDLYEVDRYFFEGLYDPNTGWEHGWEIDTDISSSGINMETYYQQYRDTDPFYHDKCDTFDTGTMTAAVLAVDSFTLGMTGESSDNGGDVSGGVSGKLSNNQSLQLLVPMSEADLMTGSSTISNYFGWIYNIRLDMSDLPVIVSQGTVAEPHAEHSLNSDNSTLTVTMSCATEGASMYFSFDGAPQIPYTGPVTLNVQERDLSSDPVAFSMIAVKEGWDDAGIVTVNCPDSPAIKMVSEDGTQGYLADTLTIKVGYFGGPYHVKHVFTLDELKNMEVVNADYTFIDNMPSVVIDHVEGVRLSEVIQRSGIDLGSVQTFYFWTKDVTQTYFTSYSKTELIDTPRYCYYSLPDNFDYDEGRGNEYAGTDGRLVDTVIALADDWNRCINGAAFGNDYEDLNSNTRFRLIFGQKDTETITASRSAKWIHAIMVELGGAPTVTIDSPSVLDLEVGSLFRTEASITAADPAISGTIEWSSSDVEIASVDTDGTITVHSEGTAVITAGYMGVTDSIVVNGKGESASSETGLTEILPQNPENQGDRYNINQSEDLGTGDAGGVQNWRIYEMEDSSVELPDIMEENRFTPVIIITALCLFFSGMIYRILKFKIDLDGGLHVFWNRNK